MNYSDRGSHAQGLYPTYTLRMGALMVKQEEQIATRVGHEWEKSQTRII